ncbi:hypothetical protein FKP32DRAFT_843967 [Trametes sanguinea]|nr:hypothetical protein FKP32DRAFT_843967 [Trametes sanguinea]
MSTPRGPTHTLARLLLVLLAPVLCLTLAGCAKWRHQTRRSFRERRSRNTTRARAVGSSFMQDYSEVCGQRRNCGIRPHPSSGRDYNPPPSRKASGARRAWHGREG